MPTPSDTGDRVLVVGCSGAGKSVFAGRIAERLGCERVELDAVHWGPDWTPRPEADIRRDLAPIIEGERWVVDGNYQMLSDLLWPRATTVIWLDYSLGLCLWRALKRTVGRAWRRELLWGTNRESLVTSFLSRDSILLWVVRMHGPRRRALAEAVRRPENAHLVVHRFRRTSEAEAFLTGGSIAGLRALRQFGHNCQR